jgi:hypothetical protein
VLIAAEYGRSTWMSWRARGRMKLVAMLNKRESITRYLAGIGELTDVPERSPSRGPPSWKSTVLRRKALGDAA